MKAKIAAGVFVYVAIYGLVGVALPSCDSKPSKPKVEDTEDEKPSEKKGDGGGPAKVAGYEIAKVTNGGTLKGVVAWAAGDAKKWEHYPYEVAPGDKETCGKGGHVHDSSRKNERLKLGDRGAGKKPGVKDTVVWLEVTKGEGLPGPGSVTLDNSACEFVPHVFLIPGRQTKIEVKTSDGAVAHNSKGTFVFGDMSSDLFNPQIAGDKRFLHTGGFPADEGRLQIVCSQHYWMGAFGILQKHPYYAVTDDKGNFEIKTPILPGKYKLHFWHAGWSYKVEKKDGKTAGVNYDEPAAWSQEVEIKAGENDAGEVELKGK